MTKYIAYRKTSNKRPPLRRLLEHGLRTFGAPLSPPTCIRGRRLFETRRLFVHWPPAPGVYAMIPSIQYFNVYFFVIVD